jgi:hypothetical protein
VLYDVHNRSLSHEPQPGSDIEDVYSTNDEFSRNRDLTADSDVTERQRSPRLGNFHSNPRHRNPENAGVVGDPARSSRAEKADKYYQAGRKAARSMSAHSADRISASKQDDYEQQEDEAAYLYDKRRDDKTSNVRANGAHGPPTPKASRLRTTSAGNTGGAFAERAKARQAADERVTSEDDQDDYGGKENRYGADGGQDYWWRRRRSRSAGDEEEFSPRVADDDGSSDSLTWLEDSLKERYLRFIREARNGTNAPFDQPPGTIRYPVNEGARSSSAHQASKGYNAPAHPPQRPRHSGGQAGYRERPSSDYHAESHRAHNSHPQTQAQAQAQVQAQSLKGAVSIQFSSVVFSVLVLAYS